MTVVLDVGSDVARTHLREWNVVLRHFSLPVLHQLFAELLVERTGVRQEAGSQEDIADEAIDLRLEALAGCRPPDLLARQPVDQRRRHVHLASACVRIIHQRLQQQQFAAVTLLSAPVNPFLSTVPKWRQ